MASPAKAVGTQTLDPKIANEYFDVLDNMCAEENVCLLGMGRPKVNPWWNGYIPEDVLLNIQLVDFDGNGVSELFYIDNTEIAAGTYIGVKNFDQCNHYVWGGTARMRMK